MADKLTVCVCGGGNGAHAMAGLAAAHPNTESRVLTLFQDEAARWTSLLKEGDFTIKRNMPDKSVVEIKAKPAMVTKDASQAIPGANMIIFCVPAFAHAQYFSAIAPYVQPITAIIGLPGQPGFEFQCLDILKEDVAKKCAILSYESLPWACRILQFGKLVEILGAKDSLMGSVIRGQSRLPMDPMQTLQAMLGEHPVLRMANNYLEPYLMTKSIVHPPLMYARWRNWDGQPMAEKPLFYQGLDDVGAASLSAVSDEVVATAQAISKQCPQLSLSHVQHLLEWYRQDYRETVQDPTCLLTAMRTNAAYNGLVHPMKDDGQGKWLPDFAYRYLAEDVPFGLVVTKGLAQLAGVPSPETDRVLAWCQEKLGKEYIVGTELKGKDLASTRAPQAYGYKSLDDLVALMQ
ncbi:opine dehydrogenase-like [Babylonia areolata]|uniref:opine dehydrogenase-like n=1 Tax=Babylonia areolata TaxID=304850 RepID=UPI003FD14505